MEKSLQCMHGDERINYFGVRHLSPSASYHLIQFLEDIRPKCILIEGPSDCGYLINDLANPKVKPPIALLCYTTDVPVNSLMYPFAEYSPEYQGILWGVKNKADIHFIDLPSDVALAYSFKKDMLNEDAENYYTKEHEVYQSIAALNKEASFSDYWERNFEHNLNENSFRETMLLQSSEIRNVLEPYEINSSIESNAKNIVRESYMKRKILDKLEEGFKPEEIVVVTGAYHGLELKNKSIPMTDEEINLLPRRNSQTTLMPYSFYRLSSRSGYGAGNTAPAYFQLMWDCMKDNKLEDLPSQYITSIGRYIRENGGYCSTASIIEALRLSLALTSLRKGSLPALSDLHDGIISCIGHGDTSETMEAFAMADIGTAIGELPEGVSQTPIQDDLNRALKNLKLEKYKSAIRQELQLDIRENRKVKSEELAFIDLSRSTLFHRLTFLHIDFCKKIHINQTDATWKEKWELQWTPEVEIQTVEAVLKGETIELAASYQLAELLADCDNIMTAAKLVSESCLCKLTENFETALQTLQNLISQSENFIETVKATQELSSLINYGDIRKINTEPLIPIFKQLFFHCALILPGISSYDDKTAREMAQSINVMQFIAQENFEIIDENHWINSLKELAEKDDKNYILSGLAFAILLEKNLIDEEDCSKEISRRLSKGTPVDISVGWFEGMSMRNRYALISRIELWQELDKYVQSLDDEEFKSSVVALRRTFGSFEPREKSSVAELLGELWNLNPEEASIILEAPLDEDENLLLDDLNDFDFDF